MAGVIEIRIGELKEEKQKCRETSFDLACALGNEVPKGPLAPPSEDQSRAFTSPSYLCSSATSVSTIRHARD
jgi:hypothetical protein